MSQNSSLNASAKVYSVLNRAPITIEKFLGGGGQGEVYKVQYNGQPYALKWFHEHTSTQDQRECVEKLVRQGKPSANFLWPLELAESEGSRAFGYLMELREQRFEGFDSIVTQKVDPLFSVLIKVGLNLVDSFHSLHAKGLCYRDINFGNGFFDPKTGEVLICDNDNVAENHTRLNTVLGTPDFMAPEVVTRTSLPSRDTDHFSLAILLFYLYHIQHPLLGKKILSIRSWDLPAREKLFGTEPVFIFDPTDKSNQAINDKAADPLGEAGRNAMPYWERVYPQILKDAFITSFTEGIRQPQNRLSGSRWTDVLTRCAESVFICSACGKENFYDEAAKGKKCWSCDKAAAPKFMVEIENRRIVLSPGTQIHQFQLDGSRFEMLSEVVAEVVKHPTHADVFGLRNNTKSSWSATPANAPSVEIPSGKSIPLHDGTEVRIGRQRVKIVSVA